MEKTNLENLNRLAKLFGTDRLISPEEIQQIFKGIVEILATYKKDTSSINEDTKSVVNKLLEDVISIHKESVDAVEEKKKELGNDFADKLTELRQMVTSIQEEMDKEDEVPEDDTDDEEEKQALIAEIMAQITLPEYKETIITGEDLVDKINALSLDEENKIDYARLKNVPVIKGKVITGSPTVLANAVDLDGSTRQDTYAIVWDAARGRYTHAAGGGGGGGAVDSVNGQTGVVVLDADDISDTSTTHKFTTAAEITKLAGIETGADVTDATNVNAAGAVMNSDYTPSHSLLVQQSGTGSPTSLQIPNDTILGRLSGGGSDIDALTATEVRGLLNVADGATAYTDEMAQDAVGGIMTDSAEIDFTYNDATPSITASIVAGSIDETKLDTSVNASLDLADSSIQPTGTQSLADKTLSNAKIDYVIEPASDDTFEGEMTNDLNAGATIAQWDLVYGDSTSGKWKLADADAESTSGGVQLALAAEAKTDTQAMNVIFRGVVRNDGWTWSGAFKPLYVSTTAGGMTETAPSGASDVIRVVGYTLSDDAIYFNPDNSWVVHA